MTKTFKELPVMLQIQIFKYLSLRNLKYAALVCKEWSNLIESEFKWTVKLAFDDRGRLMGRKIADLGSRKQSIVFSNRTISNMSVNGGRLNADGHMLSIMKKHGKNLITVRLDNVSVDSLLDVVEVLKHFSKVEHATIQIKNNDRNNVLLMEKLLPDLQSLKSLVFHGCDYGIIKCFRKAKLSTIKIWEDTCSNNRTFLVDFLSTQNKLTSLSLDTYSSSILVEMGKLNVPIPFRLTQLSISDMTCQKPSQDHDHLMKFVESQAGLGEIEMNREISSSVYECVFANMTKLTTLSVITNQLPEDDEVYDRLEENRTVHTVRLRDKGCLNYRVVGKFLQKFPRNLCLVLSNENRFMTQNILVMAQCLLELNSLCIREIHANSLDNVKFPSLKTLHIQHLRGRINWTEFIRAHPLLTELIVKKMDNCSYLTTDDIDRMTTNLDLQHIKLGDGFVADNRFFKIVGSKCANLKVLDLHKSCISKNFRHNIKIDVLRLHDNITCPHV